MNEPFPHHRIQALRRQLNRVLSRDRRSLGSDIDRIQRELTKKAAAQDRVEAVLAQVEARIAIAVGRRDARILGKPSLVYPEALPIVVYKGEIIDAITTHPVVIIAGETGSGKTTQIPKFCLEAGRGIDGMIGCTQPRRIAAVSVAKRISEELGDPEGKAVGYQVRFQDHTPRDAYIKVMTDGILLAESQRDRRFSRYDTLIVDEAHERSLNIDFILGLLRRILEKRNDLKVIVTSATIDTDKFSKAFDNAPIIEVSGRMYPVTVEYRPAERDEIEEGETQTDAPSHVAQAVEAVVDIHTQSAQGDILVFMPTEQDIRETCLLLEKRITRHAVILPLFARLTADRQARVFDTCVGRKIIVATNIAETSLTIPGIRFVVDTGLARISRYVPRSRMTTLPVAPISRASADQRKGRCGRVAHGICIRLYEEADYLSRPEFTAPEIQRANLAEVILRMAALGMGDPADFPFIDPPDPRAIRDGVEILFELGALVRSEGTTVPKSGKNTPMRLTDIGRIMARFPLDPRLTRILIESAREGCLPQAAILVAALSIQDPRERPADQADKADQAQREFVDPLSDFITLLNIWKKFHAVWETTGRTGLVKKFCKSHFLSFRRMREWRDIHEQILDVVAESELQHMEVPPRPVKRETGPFPERYGAIHRSILSGFLSNIACRKEKNMFMAARSKSVMIFPGSGLFNRAGQWIVAAEMVETSRPFARTVAAIDPRWLEPLGGDMCRYTHFDPRWDPKRGEVVVTKQVSLFGLVIVPGRAVAYGPIDPEAATEIFIRSALVEGELDRTPEFLKRNRKLVDEIRRMEDKVRRRDLLVSDETIMAFYRERLKGVSDIRNLNRRIRDNGDGFLLMAREDLLQKDPDADEMSRFPDHLELGQGRYVCDYRFIPGAESDGVTVRIPSARAAEIPEGLLEWGVPGLFREKVEALLKGLPKSLRKQLVPVHRTAQIVEKEMPKGDGVLMTRLGEFIHHRFGVSIPADAWTEKELPGHLRTRIAITDATGRTVQAGRDPKILKAVVAQVINTEALEAARRKWAREGITYWDFGDLPDTVTIDGENRTRWEVYPGLCVSGKDLGTVSLKIFTDRRGCAVSHAAGVAALFSRRFARDFAFLRRSLSAANPVSRKNMHFGGEKAFLDRMIRCVEKRLFSVDIRTRADFESHGTIYGPQILTTGADLVASVTPVVKAYADAWGAFRAVGLRSGGGHPLTRISQALIRDLETLVPLAFMERYEPERFFHIVRYIRAMILRLERAGIDMEKDRAKADRIKPFIDWYHAVTECHDDGSAAKAEAMDTFFWMLEEFKVSVFAQELGTAIPISEKRLKEKMGEIERMA